MKKILFFTILFATFLVNSCKNPSESLVEKSNKKIVRHSSAHASVVCETQAFLLNNDGETVYEVNYIGSDHQGCTGGSTWTYTITRRNQGQGQGEWLLDMGCGFVPEDILSISIGGFVLPNSDYGFTSGVGCGVGSFIKIPGMRGKTENIDQAYTITLKLAKDFDEACGKTYISAGGVCNGDEIVSPGCFHIGGTVTREVCSPSYTTITEPYANATVTITDGTTTWTVQADGSGIYNYPVLAPGTYTITIDGTSIQVIISGCSAESANILVPLATPCVVPGCSFSQGYYFASPVGTATWTSVTVGGISYSKAEGIVLFGSRKTGYANISNAFTQAATIKLSVTAGKLSLSNFPSLATNLAIIDAYLATLGKLSAYTNFPKNVPANVVAASSAISDFIALRHCD